MLEYVIADAWGHMSGWGWSWMLAGWLFWILAIAAGVFAMARWSRGTRPPGANEILEERFARGEITAEEFEARRKVLRG